MENQKTQNIANAIEKVEHPAIAATLMELGMLRDIEIDRDGKVSLTLVLPFESVPEQIIAILKNFLSTAIESLEGELQNVNLALMNQDEVQNFLTIETQNWRG